MALHTEKFYNKKFEIYKKTLKKHYTDSAAESKAFNDFVSDYERRLRAGEKKVLNKVIYYSKYNTAYNTARNQYKLLKKTKDQIAEKLAAAKAAAADYALIQDLENEYKSLQIPKLETLQKQSTVKFAEQYSDIIFKYKTELEEAGADKKTVREEISRYFFGSD